MLRFSALWAKVAIIGSSGHPDISGYQLGIGGQFVKAIENSFKDNTNSKTKTMTKTTTKTKTQTKCLKIQRMLYF